MGFLYLMILIFCNVNFFKCNVLMLQIIQNCYIVNYCMFEKLMIKMGYKIVYV